MITDFKENFLKTKFKTLAIENKYSFSELVKNLFVFSVNHKTAPIPIREKFAIPEYRLQEAILIFKNCASIKSHLILSTCNRTEIYFITSDFEKALSDIYDFLEKFLGIERKIAKEYQSISKQEEVINYTFEVGSGLDSLVVGERQILSQIKKSYYLSQTHKTLDNTLETLFQTVIKTAKEVHKKTNLSKNSQSISSAVIDLAGKIAGPLKEKKIMVLGAGKMAKLALERILKLGGAKETVVLNKSPHRVIEFAEPYKVDKSIPFENVYEAITDVDIVVTATGAPHFILFAEQLKEKRKDESKKLFVFDISMPRNVDSEIGKLPNVTLIDIDSLQNAYNELVNVSELDINKAKKIIQSNKKDFYKNLSMNNLSPTIKELRDKFEQTRLEKLSQFTKGKKSFTLEELDYITKNISNTLLHEEINKLKASKLEDKTV